MLYVVRHGQTEWNIAKRFQGQQDSPLSNLGQRQAQAAAAFLRNAGIDQLYASPLGRAWDTAETIARQVGKDRVSDDRLKECGFGACEGMTLADIEEAFPGKTAWREGDKWNRRYPDGESYLDVVQRISTFAEEKLSDALRNDGPVICVVAHDMVNRCLVGHLSNWSQAQIMTRRQGNDEVFVLSPQGTERIMLSKV
ncbi:histidine phosphatase family protein [Pelagibius sp. Alg239-R121]|uniref:histidine phosphatase family protein n=1 Tax=Pelagibius sp. Alg239-R121 TaxID=2993448 RepID=UPI0024A68D92|nr:histidine phosphatase family protein [Pelagibius sp. Alg239-R121]